MKKAKTMFSIGLILACLMLTSQNVYSQVSASDSLALVALYTSTDGPNWINNTNWLSDQPVCKWYGVETVCIETDETSGQCKLNGVWKLNLTYNGLKGTIPPEIGNLTYLKVLWLYGNQLTGQIPDELINLINLLSLCLDHNQLTGTIPPELVNLVNLTELNLGGNQLTGTIPSGLDNLFNLKSLDLVYNLLTGPIPRELGNLVNLTSLNLGGNLLTGSIPTELGNLLNLQYLSLHNNELTGPIPPELGNLLNLKLLDLYKNELKGPIPSESGNLLNLQYLSLGNNMLTGPIPPDLGNLVNLTELYLGANQLTGIIPSGFGNLVNLTRLYLGVNQLTGTIPTELGNLLKIKYLDLDNNMLTGPIPPEFGNLVNLTDLNILGNQLTGTVPSGLGNLVNLTKLNLVGNQLTGTIPTELGNLLKIKYLDLANNMLTGPIPLEFGNLVNLTDLNLVGNQFTGTIPSGLGNLVNLTKLSLVGNQLTGTIPTELGNLLNLKYLALANNMLTGPIPPELGNLVNLTYFDLGGNQLTGSLPPELGNLVNLKYFYLNQDNLTGVVPISIAQICSSINCYLENNELCIPDTKAYRDIGVNPIGGLYLDPTCGINTLSFYNTYLPAETKLVASYNSGDEAPIPAKICADGSEETTLISFKGKIENGNLLDIVLQIEEDNSGSDLSRFGTFKQVSVTQDSIIFSYQHPLILDTQGLYQEIHLLAVNKANNNEIILKYPIHIYRAPVLMVHGLWAGPDAFSEIDSELLKSGQWTDELTEKVDYHLTNGSAFEYNFLSISAQIRSEITKAVEAKFSAGKVNVVAHSMGGLLTRLYIQSDYYNNNICRLITLNTPHSGSQMANFLLEQPELVTVLNLSFRKTDANGAVGDLRVDSPVILNDLNGVGNLNRHSVPSYAITTWATVDNLEQEAVLKLLLNYLKLKFLDPSYLILNKIFQNDYSDIIVALESQKGGLGFYNNGNVLNQWHNSTENTEVISRVINLLNKDPQEDYIFASDGFNPPTLTYDFKSLKKAIGVNQVTSEYINFTSPANASIVNAGDELTVSISASSGVSDILFAAGNPVIKVSSEVYKGPSATFTYQVPLDATGIINLVAMGFDNNKSIALDSLQIKINVAANFDSISLLHKSEIVYVNQCTSLNVIGHYDDGIDRNLSYNPDVKYIVNDVQLAKFIEPGVIQGNSEGTTSAVISFQGKQAIANITILPLQSVNVGIDEIQARPKQKQNSTFVLYQNYPNPCNESTSIEYLINKPGKVSLTIFNVFGQKIKSFDEGFRVNGNYNLKFDSQRYPGGIYFYRLCVGASYETKAMILIK